MTKEGHNEMTEVSGREERLLQQMQSPLYRERWCWAACFIIVYGTVLRSDRPISPLFIFWTLGFLLLADRSASKKRAQAVAEWIKLQKGSDSH
jgi:hypothetical protein